MRGVRDMLTITVIVDAPSWAAQGVKEHLAMYLERYGDVRVVAIHSTQPQGADRAQLSIERPP